MDKAELIKQIKTSIGKPKIKELGRILKNGQFDIRDLIAVTFYPDEAIAFRATWLLENVFLDTPEAYLPHLEYILFVLKDVKYEGPKRHYAKLVMHITDARAPDVLKNKIQTIDFEPVVEQLFDWLIDAKAKIAVKVFASEALYNLRHRYDWIAEELVNQLHYMMKSGGPAIQVRGKKILMQMAKEKGK